MAVRRSPYGERGLKYLMAHGHVEHDRRSPYGERGLKYRHRRAHRRTLGRSPYGERGLKYIQRIEDNMTDESLSLRRAWIEIAA